ncbi:MAG: hypothetical protein OEQ29_19425 [Alphaproteobacteria bacterium]|nr:hypothetical protein [Alphaproteobacteria bacterium]
MRNRLQRSFRPVILFVMTAMLAGCAADGTGDPMAAQAGVRDVSIVSRTLAGGEFVEVEIRHRSHFRRVAQVALIAPNGEWHRARDVRTRRTDVYGGRPRGHFGIAGGSSGPIFTGVGISIPIGGLFRAPTHRTRALVRVPDPAGYRASSTRWTVAVVMEQGLGSMTTIKRPAPAVR